MRRTTVTLPEDLHYHLTREAERCGSTVSEVVRSALNEKLNPPGKQPPFLGIGSSKEGDISSNFEKYLKRDRLRRPGDR